MNQLYRNDALFSVFRGDLLLTVTLAVTVGGDSIQKQDLIRVHADLAKMKSNYEKMGYREEFSEYHDLYITPMHVHKSKDEHEKAIYVLSSKLSMIVAEENAIYQTAKIKTKSYEKIDKIKTKIFLESEKDEI